MNASPRSAGSADGTGDPFAGPLVPKKGGRSYLAAEFVLLFVAVPMLLYVFRHRFGAVVIPGILTGGAVCLGLLLADRHFDRRPLWRVPDVRNGGMKLAGRFAALAAPIALVLGVTRADLLLDLPREEPKLWATIMIVYPLLSAYPQEVIFRSFLFHRYRGLFPTSGARIWASGLAFGAAHLFYANIVAAVLATAGGLLFGSTYARTRSVPLVAAEHTVWGWFVFTVGLGYFFYGRAIG